MNRSIAKRIRQRVLVTVKTGEAFEGILFEADKRAFVLRQAALMTDDGKRISVDGELVVLTADVAYVQVR